MRRSAWALVMATAGLVACSGGSGEVAPVSFDPVATTVPQVVTTPAPSTTEVTTTVPMTTAPSLPVSDLTGPVFSDELGVKVATAPGVNTPGDTRQLLPEGLYVHIAWTADPNDPSVFTVQPDDIPILEAYANAVTAYYRAAMSTMTTSDPDFDVYFVNGGEPFEKSFAEYREIGQRIALQGGVVLRPYLLSDETTTASAVVLDCYLTDETYLMEGEVVPLPAAPAASGQLVTMVLLDGRWLVDKAGSEPQACV